MGKVRAHRSAFTGLHFLFLNPENSKRGGEGRSLKLKAPPLRKFYVNQDGKLRHDPWKRKDQGLQVGIQHLKSSMAGRQKVWGRMAWDKDRATRLGWLALSSFREGMATSTACKYP